MPYDLFPSDFVPKANPHNQNERELFGSSDIVEFVQVKFHRSTYFVKNPRDDFLEPDQKLVINTMENDKYLFERTPEDEFERYEELNGVADIAFPSDRWTWGTMGPRETLQEIERSVEGQIEVYRLVTDAGLDIELYPIIVGWEPWHFEQQRELFEVFDTTSCAFDATQYYSINRLVNHLNNLSDRPEVEEIYLNGCISPAHLRAVPREVVAFSGIHRLLKEAKLPEGSHSRELIREGIADRITANDSWQASLADFQGGQITGD